jgi:hypothetical protein
MSSIGNKFFLPAFKNKKHKNKKSSVNNSLTKNKYSNS